MPVLMPTVLFSERDIPALQDALKILMEKRVSDVVEKDRDKLFFMTVHSAIEDLFEYLQLTDHIWIVPDAAAAKVLGLLTLDDVRRLLLPVKKTYSGLRRRGPSSLRHRSIGCIGCLMEKAVLRSVSPAHSVADALELMESYDLSYIAVVKDEEFIGEVSVRKLASVLTKLIAEVKSGKV